MRAAEALNIQHWSKLLARATDNRVAELETENENLKRQIEEFREVVDVLLDRNRKLTAERFGRKEETVFTRRPMSDEERQAKLSSFFGGRS